MKQAHLLTADQSQFWDSLNQAQQQMPLCVAESLLRLPHRNVQRGEFLSHLYKQAKRQEHGGARDKLYREFSNFAMDLARSYGWSATNSTLLTRAAMIAVDLNLCPQYFVTCHACFSPIGYSNSNGCEKCEGFQVSHKSGRSLGAMLAVRDDSTVCEWARRISFLADLISNWES